ncbi:MAG: transglutaminaseTgpA domain-containing protein, partial [Myxococcales bacterium]|nr:transglutaminaseTgpA domain-containing protein [Myxococcales bacterium]
YTRFWSVAAVVVLVLQIARTLGGEAVLTVGVQYAAFLQLSRLAHRKAAADYQQIAILGFLHLIAGTVMSTGLDYAVVFFGFVIVMPWMLALTHLRRELEIQFGMGTPLLQAELQSRELATPAFFGGTTLLAVPLFVLTAAMFFAFPRVGFGLLSNLGARVQSVAGFGNDVELGGFGIIRDDPTVVMRVKMAEMPRSPPQSIGLRLRGTSFDRYRAGRWSRTQITGKDVRRLQDEYVVHRPPKVDDERYEIILDPMEEAVLFIPEGTVALQVPPAVRAGRNQYRKIVQAPGLDLRYRERFEAPLTYLAYANPSERAFPERIPQKLQARYLEVPDGYERISELAQSIAGGSRRPIDKAQRIEGFLRGGGGYRYSLEQPNTEGKDPLHVFLFEAKAGHCEYFSTAMAIMMRALGLPARNVTGFLGADYNPYGGYYAVRNGNAHSWVEVLIDGKWVTFDPTPASRQVSTVSYGLAVKFRQMMDAVRVRWAEYIVEFNIRDQARALQGFAAWYQSLRGDRRAARLRTETPDEGHGGLHVPLRPDWRWFVAIMSIFGGGVLFVRWNQKQRRRTRAGRHLDPDRDRAVRLYLSLEDSLRHAGQARPPDVTPAEHADQLGRSGFPAADVVSEITDAYLATRFGEMRMSPHDYHRLRQVSRSVRAKAKSPPIV